MDILNQLGGLMLGSVPTVICFIFLAIAYAFLVRRPLERTLEERRLRTSGAMEQARGAISAAEAETAMYENKLRAARAEILAAREAKLQQWGRERDAMLQEVRTTAGDRVRAARAEISDSAERARVQMEGVSAQLSDRILEAILPAGAQVAEAQR